MTCAIEFTGLSLLVKDVWQRNCGDRFRLSEQQFRVDKWALVRRYASAQLFDNCRILHKYCEVLW